MKNYDVKKIYQWPLGARVVVIAAVSLLLLLLGYVIDIQPYKGEIANSIKHEENLKEQLQLMLDRQVTIKGNIAQLPTLTALLREWQQRILTKDELPNALNEILKMGQNNRLKISSFNPASETRDGIYYKTPVTMDITGTYDQIANFISQLANHSKLLNIDAFTINREQDKNAQVDSQSALNSNELLTAKLDIEIYRK